jgi:diaminopimelate decarboxylase
MRLCVTIRPLRAPGQGPLQRRARRGGMLWGQSSEIGAHHAGGAGADSGPVRGEPEWLHLPGRPEQVRAALAGPHPGRALPLSAEALPRAGGRHRERFRRLDPTRVPTPCFVVDEAAVEENLRFLDRVQRESGARILLALKAFSMFAMAPLLSRYLAGTCASGLYEARLGREAFGGEVHTFSPAYPPRDLDEILELSDHVLFNSLTQCERFQPQVHAAKVRRPGLRLGLRVNPEHTEGWNRLYDPCAPGSHLGIPASRLAECSLGGVSGLHFHTLCEQDLPPLERTLAAVEERFGRYLDGMQWLNLGGGHHLASPGK